jgi:Ca-activated chloride channel family protein
MEIDLTAFHFLRPAWLLLLIPAFGLPFVWLRRNDVRARWRGVIAPQLLEHLIVGGAKRRVIQPVHTLALLLGIGAIAAAGPTWQQERPPFNQDKAPLVVVLELAHSMDATDIAPTRLERAKQKVLDLARARKGARTGLVVFASTGHLVVPPTEDPAMLELYVPALSPALMPRDGKNAAAGLDVAERLLENDPAAGTIVFMSDGFDANSADAFVRKAKSLRHQLLWLAVGTEHGGPIRAPDGMIQMDAEGHPLLGTFDADAIRTVARDADIPLASMRADDDDVAWVQHRAQAYLAQAEETRIEPRWKESGYWLVLPLLLLALWSFRRGWTVKWLPVVLISLYSRHTTSKGAGISTTATTRRLRNVSTIRCGKDVRNIWREITPARSKLSRGSRRRSRISISAIRSRTSTITRAQSRPTTTRSNCNPSSRRRRPIARTCRRCWRETDRARPTPKKNSPTRCRSTRRKAVARPR